MTYICGIFTNFTHSSVKQKLSDFSHEESRSKSPLNTPQEWPGLCFSSYHLEF